MLGIRIENKKLYIIPKIPKAWDGYRAALQYQNSKINISVKRGEKSRITDNGKDCVYIALDGETHNVEVILE
jgi:cellobiose phosphorylase